MNVEFENAGPSQQSFETFLERCYDKAESEHSHSVMSWARTRLTGLGAAGQATGAAGVVTGVVEAAGHSVPSAFVGAAVTATSVGVAATLFALPASVFVLAAASWGKGKYDHHKVNKEIWDWFKANSHQKGPERGSLIAGKTIHYDTAMRWLQWFADEGIANMAHLSTKLEDAKSTLDDRYKTLAAKLSSEAAKAAEARRRGASPASVRATLESNLAQAFVDLGTDFEYVRYRLHRLLMYHQVMDVIAKALAENYNNNLSLIRTETQRHCTDTETTLLNLWKKIHSIMA
jgi:hypothetical protein